MNLVEDINPPVFKELLAEIHNRSAALPDFQLWPVIRRVIGVTETTDLETDAKGLE